MKAQQSSGAAATATSTAAPAAAAAASKSSNNRDRASGVVGGGGGSVVGGGVGHGMAVDESIGGLSGILPAHPRTHPAFSSSHPATGGGSIGGDSVDYGRGNGAGDGVPAASGRSGTEAFAAPAAAAPWSSSEGAGEVEHSPTWSTPGQVNSTIRAYFIVWNYCRANTQCE